MFGAVSLSAGGGPPRRGGRGGNSGKGGPYQSSHCDRFCFECGFIVKGQASEKPKKCPRCKAAMPLRGDAFEWDENGWGRCPECDSFMQKDMSYCQACSKSNPGAIARKRQQAKAAAAREKHLLEKERKDTAERIRRLEEAQRHLSRQLMEKDRALEDMGAIVASQEAELKDRYTGTGEPASGLDGDELGEIVEDLSSSKDVDKDEESKGQP